VATAELTCPQFHPNQIVFADERMLPRRSTALCAQRALGITRDVDAGVIDRDRQHFVDTGRTELPHP
jgi:hypothetical protein